MVLVNLLVRVSLVSCVMFFGNRFEVMLIMFLVLMVMKGNVKLLLLLRMVMFLFSVCLIWLM